MLKNATYAQKMAMLKDCLQTIVQEIKKDLKTDHLRKDVSFVKSYFPQKNVSKLTVSELAEGYAIAIEDSERADALGEFIANRWLLKNTDVYDYFANQLHQVTDDFASLDVLDADLSKKIMVESIQHFGAQKTYLFSVFNSVVFPEVIFNELREQAKIERLQAVESERVKNEQVESAITAREFEQRLSRLTDRYEKRLTGMEKKYLKDVETLKKQIASLQRKLEQHKGSL